MSTESFQKIAEKASASRFHFNWEREAPAFLQPSEGSFNSLLISPIIFSSRWPYST